MSEQITEAVARAICEAGNSSNWEHPLECAQAAIAAHTKALVDGAGEVGKRLAQQMCNRRGEELCGCHLCAALVDAAATIAALQAQLATARIEGVRAGIEAAKEEWTDSWTIFDCRIRTLDPAAIIRRQALSELAAADAVLLDDVGPITPSAWEAVTAQYHRTKADSDGDGV